MDTKALTISAAALLVAVGSLSARAQTEKAPALEEIVVTAQKREQSLQSVPISITALTGEDMRETDIFSLDGIAERTPGFSMGSFNKGQPQLRYKGFDESLINGSSRIRVGKFA